MICFYWSCSISHLNWHTKKGGNSMRILDLIYRVHKNAIFKAITNNLKKSYLTSKLDRLKVSEWPDVANSSKNHSFFHLESSRHVSESVTGKLWIFRVRIWRAVWMCQWRSLRCWETAHISNCHSNQSRCVACCGDRKLDALQISGYVSGNEVYL